MKRNYCLREESWPLAHFDAVVSHRSASNDNRDHNLRVRQSEFQCSENTFHYQIARSTRSGVLFAIDRCDFSGPFGIHQWRDY